MKKVLCLTVAVMLVSAHALAEKPAAQPVVEQPVKEKQVSAPKAEKAPKRKKRVLICKECGKPEPQCECEGEGHRKN